MKRLLVLTVGLCLVVSTAIAKEALKQDVKMMEDSQGLFDDTPRGLFGVAQAGTTWLGWMPGGYIGSPGYWDFDDRGTHACPIENDFDEYLKNGAYAQGWTSEDVYAQKGLFWYTEDFTDPGFGATVPITGTYSAWCGKVTPDVGECFNDAPGYGHNWSQWLCRSVTMDPVTPRLQYTFRSDTESGFDYAYVFIDAEYPDSCGWVGDYCDTIKCYTGPRGTTAEDIDLANWTADPDMCDAEPCDGDYSGDSVKVCFVVVSDGGWDDEDGRYPTNSGAMTLDDIIINVAYSSGDTIITNFETGTLEGWTRCGGWSPGDYVAIRDRDCFINYDECGFTGCYMEGCVLTFYNPNIPGDYAAGGHYAGDFFKRAWSPTIDMTSYSTRGYVIGCDRYADLPITNWVFYRYYVKYVQDVNCPTGAWSPALTDNEVYYAPKPVCDYRAWGFSQYVPLDADSVKIGLAVWNGCNVWGVPCTNGNESPIFDNIRLGIWDLSGPQAGIRDIDNYTDAFPEADTLFLPAEPGDCGVGAVGNTALIDVANNKSSSGAFLRLADSLVVELNAPYVYAELCFRIRPGPCTDLTDPWWARMGISPVTCELSDIACVRMDTAFAAGDGDPASDYEHQVTFQGYWASMIHENDGRYLGEGEEIFPDSLFTPGTQISYYVRTSFLPGPFPYAYLPATLDPGDPNTWYEVAVLPDRCVPDNCLLYVDYYNRGAQAPIENALTLLGRTWDRFDLRAEGSHQGNGIGNRLLGAGRYRLARGPIGPSLNHLTQYSIMLMNTGDLDPGLVISDGGTGTTDDPTDDVTFLDNWIEEGRAKGLWLSGNSIAADFASAASGPKPAFLANELATDLLDTSYQVWSGHPIDESCRVLTARVGGIYINSYSGTDSLRISGSGCPANDFDVIQDEISSGRGNANVALMYDDSDGYASVDHVFTAGNAPFDTVRTKVDGFSMHYLRNLSPPCNNVDNIAIALWARDVLGGVYNHGYFYNHDLSVQYCPPQGSDDPSLPPHKRCPDGQPCRWSGNGHYYEVVASPTTWPAACAAAAAASYNGWFGHLATINDQDEDSFIAYQVVGVPDPDPDHQYWIGAYQPPGSGEPDSEWGWVTGEEWDYENWSLLQPDDWWGRSGDEDCVVLATSAGFVGTWNDICAGQCQPYIIEYEPGLPDACPTVTVECGGMGWRCPGGCPECADDVDNDGNGCRDYHSDSGCESFSDDDESGGQCLVSPLSALANWAFAILALCLCLGGALLLARRRAGAIR